MCPHLNFECVFVSPSDLAKGRSLDDISITKHADDDDDDVHDYEYIDVAQLDSIRRTCNEQNINTGKGQPSNTI